MEEQGRAIALIGRARKALAEAKTIGEVKDIRDQGQAAIKWAKSRRDIGQEAQNEAAEIVLRAERRLGEMLAETVPHNGGRPKRLHDVTVLQEHGINKTQSSRWQTEAAVEQEQFEEFVTAIRDAGKQLTSGALVKLGKQGKNRKTWAAPVAPIDGACGSLQELIDAGRKFRTIYADPPWQYGNQQTRASTDNHYTTMPLDAICAERVVEVAADDAHLHLWTTNAFLFDAKQVMEAWGFEYRSCFIWCKNQMGIGNYWRVSHEFLLLGIRGNATNFLANDQMSWLATDRTRHSQKPAEIRERIEKVSPGPRLEMYGREAFDGWMVYGNQIAAKQGKLL